MKTEVCIFNGNEVSFSLDKENNMMINATEMAKIFGKDLYKFTKSDHAKAFIESCLKPANAGLLKLGKNPQMGVLDSEKKRKSVFSDEAQKVITIDDLIVSKQRSGTWMHRVLALKFAAWLNPDFELWVFSTIDDLLFGRHVERERSFERSLRLKCESEMLLSKKDKTGEDFERYIVIRNELQRERVLRKQLTTGAISDLQMEINFSYEL